MSNTPRDSITKSILFVISLLDYMGFTIGATVFPALFLNPENHMLPVAYTTDTRVMLIGVLLAVYPLGQFLSASVFGSASDQWGRKPVLMITLLGTLIACFITALSITEMWVTALFISRFALGLFAGNVAVAQASMVDISNAKTKAANISLLQLSLGLAWVMGAPIGSFLSNSNIVSFFSYSTPFWALFIGLVGVFIGTAIYYKSTEAQRKKGQKINLTRSFSLAYEAIQHKNYRDIFLVWVIFIAGWSMFLQFLPAVLILNFNDTTQSIGIILAFMGGVFACTQIFIARKVLKLIMPEKILKISMIIPGLAALMMIFSHQWLFFYLAAFLFPFSMGFTLPALVASISNRGLPTEQGKLLGMTQSTQALMTIAATFIGGKLLSVNYHASVVVGASLMCIAWVLYLSRVEKRSLMIKAKLLQEQEQEHVKA